MVRCIHDKTAALNQWLMGVGGGLLYLLCFLNQSRSKHVISPPSLQKACLLPAALLNESNRTGLCLISSCCQKVFWKNILTLVCMKWEIKSPFIFWQIRSLHYENILWAYKIHDNTIFAFNYKMAMIKIKVLTHCCFFLSACNMILLITRTHSVRF